MTEPKQNQDPGQTNPANTLQELLTKLDRDEAFVRNTSKFVPQLWAPLVVEALKTPDWLREYLDNLPPPPPPTFKQRLRRRWHRVLKWWPLQWKDRSDDDE